jgi:hypothetical protein
MNRYKKFKRGTKLEIEETFGNGEKTLTLGYYWMNDAVNKRIVLVSTFPPMKMDGKLWEKRFCDYSLITKIKKLEVS